MVLAGWEISPLVELFLVAILFGSGTDFCLFVSWRFAEHFDAADPAGAMRLTLRRSCMALLTSAGTVITGLLLMGTTQFKLFSSTGPSVAIGLALTLAATLTLTPASAGPAGAVPAPGVRRVLGGELAASGSGSAGSPCHGPLPAGWARCWSMAPLAMLGLRTHVRPGRHDGAARGDDLGRVTSA